MPLLTIELDDIDYATLRGCSQAKRAPLAFYAADIVKLSINDAQRLETLERDMSSKRFKRSVVQPPEIESLIEEVKELVSDVAPTDFDAATWVTNWLNRPTPTLDGRKPIQYLETDHGRQLISIMLGSLALGAFWCGPATP